MNRVGHAASGGALAPQPPRATRHQPEFHGESKNLFFLRKNQVEPGALGLNLKFLWNK